jgi:putative ABC transport system permease protein
MASFLFITQYISFQYSYNRFHQHADHIYRVLSENSNGNIESQSAPGFAPIAAAQINGIEKFCRIAQGSDLGTGIVSFEHGKEFNSFRENSFAYVDGSFFDVFDFQVLNGERGALQKPNTVALSKRISAKYFDKENAIGKSITLNNQFGELSYHVVMVYEDMPSYSDLQYDLLFSIQTLENPANLGGNEGWASMLGTDSQWLSTYLLLNTTSNAEQIENLYSTLVKKAKPDQGYPIRLQSLSSMHLGESLYDPFPVFGNLKSVYLLTAIALLVASIAWFNYVNLSTAGALKRAKEVGVRKMFGASRKQLITQFILESISLNVVSVVLAFALVNALQQMYSDLVGVKMSTSMLTSNIVGWTAIFILVLGTIVSGLYAGLLLSSFKPANVLKGIFTKSSRGVVVRKSLVVLQFSIATVLIAATITIYRQWQFLQEKDLGMETDQLMVVRGAEVNKNDTFKQRSTEFEQALVTSGFIEKFCRSGNVPTDGFNYSTAGITRQNPVEGDEKVNYDILFIDDRYIDTYSMKVIAGNNFTPEMCERKLKDAEFVMINETAAGQLGFATPADATGQKIQWDEREFEVRGVIKDYHHNSPHEVIGPIIFLPSASGGYYTLKVQTRGLPEKIAMIKTFFAKSFPGNPFEFQFIDDAFAAQYQAEQQYSIIFTMASSLAVFIGCLGLFGLAAYNIEQRTKEIGIRKVLGSSVYQIVLLVSKEFLVLISIALIISLPLAWWATTSWLDSFAYRIDLSLWIFAFAGFITFIVSALTVGLRAIKGGISNPVDSLRID